MVKKAIPSAHTYACFYSSVCCSLGLRFIKEAVLCVSSRVVINKFFGALFTREVLRCGELWSFHLCEVAWRLTNILPVHLHSLVGLITAGVDSVVSVAEAPTTEWSRQHHCCVHKWSLRCCLYHHKVITHPENPKVPNRVQHLTGQISSLRWG